MAHGLLLGVRFHTHLYLEQTQNIESGTEIRKSQSCVANLIHSVKSDFSALCPKFQDFFCKHNRTIYEIACSKTKTILDKDIIDIFQDIDNEDENIKVLEM